MIWEILEGNKMKHYLFKSVLLIPVITVLAYAFPNQQAQDKVKEYIRVVNVELIVRVFDQGKLVSGLRKSDFRLSEDGQALKINGFNEFHRTMAPAPDTAVSGPVAATVQVTTKPRLFILYFWLFEPGVDYQQALDYFFKAICRANDRVLLISLRRVYEISRPDEIASQRLALAADLDDFTRRVANYRRKALSGMQIDASQGASESSRYSYFSGSQTPLDVDIKQFREFAASLKNLEMEKWVLVFCQRNLALFSAPGFASRTLWAQSNAIQGGYDIEGAWSDFLDFIKKSGSGRQPLVKFNKAEMEKMFIESGATFHLLVLDSKNKNNPLSEEAHYEEIKTGWQDVFAAISSATGGAVLEETDMTGALQKFSRQQDVYYILTYEPANKAQLKRKIKVELPGRNYDLFYNNEGLQRRIGSFAIIDIEWQEPVLKLKVENYLLDLQPQGIAGHVSLTIRAVPEQGEEMTIARELMLPEKKPEIQLKLRFPAIGNYHLFIEAVDQLGLDTARAEIKISWQGVSAPPVKPEKKVEEIIDNKRD
jgi:hypothetical protein